MASSMLSRFALGVAALAAISLPTTEASALLSCDPDNLYPSQVPAPSACCAALGAKLLEGAFVDSKGRNGYQLVTAKLIKRGAGMGACHGTSRNLTTRFDDYVCDFSGAPFETTAAYFEKLDFKWAQSDGASAPGNPTAGMIFDLGGASNQVVVFPNIDHGPNPQESIEFNVYLTNNPDATAFVEYKDVIAGKVDPNKWNEAVVLRGYREGWDTNTIADGVVFVFGLPCGINFRYVSIGAGNNGNPDPACKFIDGDNEFDAVAGLTEGGEGICPDKDKDGWPDCACANDKMLCDCNDDPNDPDAPRIHPGAPEGCAETKDLNCDGKIGVCPAGRFCRESACRKTCNSGEFKCEQGTACDNKTEMTGGQTIPPLCMPAPCGEAGFCAPGKFCIGGECVDPCANAKCPLGQACKDGECIDPCNAVKCPEGQQCQAGACVPKCTCLAISPCKPPTPACVTSGTNAGNCVMAGCESVTCPVGQHCESGADGIGACRSECETVVCPIGRKCVAGKCTDSCAGKTCAGDLVCFDGECMDPGCVGVKCTAPAKCEKGSCVAPVPPMGDVCFNCGDDTGANPQIDAGGTIDSASPGADASTGQPFEEDATPERNACSCALPGAAATASGLLAALSGLALTLARRRRRR